jgi:GNAT superfamily N-acetyltransferase
VAERPFSVDLVDGDSWRTWREIRLRALRDSPEAFGSTYEREVAFTEADFRARLGVEDCSVLATAAGRPVGMAGGFLDLPGWCHVVAMWVEPDWRGRGVGRALLDRVVSWADEHELRTHLDVTVGNDTARAFYERAGFVGTGETRPLRVGSPLTVERMVLPDAALLRPG